MAPATSSERPRAVVLGLPPAAIERLGAAAPALQVLGAPTLRDADAWLPAAAALIGWASPASVRRGAALRWVHLYGAGVERHLFPELTGSSIVLTCERGVHGASVGDHALALLLGLTRGLGWAGRRQAAGAWGREPPALGERAGRRAVIVGFGGIGRAIAARARGFGMRIVGVARRPAAAPPGVERVVGPEGLAGALAEAEVLFLALPHTAATAGLIDAAALARLPAGALVINVGRGAVVDTDALAAALGRGHLGGAGLDVCDPEPLPDGHPLWGRDDVLITPHVGGRSDRLDARREALVADNLRRFAAGAPLLGVVDPAAGY